MKCFYLLSGGSTKLYPSASATNILLHFFNPKANFLTVASIVIIIIIYFFFLFFTFTYRCPAVKKLHLHTFKNTTKAITLRLQQSSLLVTKYSLQNFNDPLSIWVIG